MAKKEEIKVKVLAHNMAGKYKLSYNFHQEVSMEKKQAEECIEAGDAMELTAWKALQKKEEESEDKK